MSNTWPLQQITDHNEVALSRYTYQYTEAGTLQALTTLWAERMQALEDAAWSVLTERWIAPAAGVQLDELGDIVGEPRLGRTDETYRDALEVRISINRSGGEPERIIEFLTRIAGANQVLYQEVYPAKIELFVGGDVSLEQAQRVREIVPAAVGTIYISESGGELPFGTSELGSPDPTDVDGFGELGIHDWGLDTGDVLEFVVNGDTFVAGLTDKDDPILPTDGGVIAELYEV